MAVTLREATEADQPSLEVLRRQAIEATLADEYDREAYADLVAAPDEHLAEWLAAEKYVAILAETPVTPVAYGVAERGTGQITALYTSPDYARRGYGSRVLAALEDRLDTHVYAVRAPEPVVPFFRNQGYEVTGEPRGEPIPHVRLSKRVKDP